jgi:hypothetical protein
MLEHDCSVPSCDKPATRDMLQLCEAHYIRKHRHGTTMPSVPLGGARPKRQRENVKYRGAHKRIERTWGKARNHSCLGCGGPASQWAYDYTDPDERSEIVSGKPMAYSQWPEFYMPMCSSCHLTKDRNRDGYVWRS